MPIKIKHLRVVVQALDANGELQQEAFELDGYQNRLLMPDANELRHELFSVETLVDFNAMHSFVYGLQLECTDVAEVTRHQFDWSLNGGLRHTLLPVRALTFWAIAVQRLRAIKRRMDQMAEWDSRTKKN